VTHQNHVLHISRSYILSLCDAIAPPTFGEAVPVVISWESFGVRDASVQVLPKPRAWDASYEPSRDSRLLSWGQRTDERGIIYIYAMDMSPRRVARAANRDVRTTGSFLSAEEGPQTTSIVHPSALADGAVPSPSFVFSKGSVTIGGRTTRHPNDRWDWSAAGDAFIITSHDVSFFFIRASPLCAYQGSSTLRLLVMAPLNDAGQFARCTHYSRGTKAWRTTPGVLSLGYVLRNLFNFFNFSSVFLSSEAVQHMFIMVPGLSQPKCNNEQCVSAVASTRPTHSIAQVSIRTSLLSSVSLTTTEPFFSHVVWVRAPFPSPPALCTARLPYSVSLRNAIDRWIAQRVREGAADMT
jgi:hypothetical protein